MRSIVVIPTYNECENITQIVEAVLAAPGRFDVIVVDDNSPDGTADLVLPYCEMTDRVCLLRHTSRRGFGPSCVEGLKLALEKEYEAVLIMDADFSHDPADLPRLKDALEGADMVIGSRYCSGRASVVNWSRHRLCLSRFAAKYVRLITGMPIGDPTSGFRAFTNRALEAINLGCVQSNGYAFQVETLARAHLAGLEIAEIPIIFTERREGRSKMCWRMIFEAAVMVWRLCRNIE